MTIKYRKIIALLYSKIDYNSSCLIKVQLDTHSSCLPS